MLHRLAVEPGWGGKHHVPPGLDLKNITLTSTHQVAMAKAKYKSNREQLNSRQNRSLARGQDDANDDDDDDGAEA